MVSEIIIFNFIINSISLGAYYSLLAIGFSLIYGVGGILNLAHGGYTILTGYLVLLFIPLFIGFEWMSIIFALIVITIIGTISYIAFIKPMEKTPTGVLLITFAIAYFIEVLLIEKFTLTPVTIYQIKVEGFLTILPDLKISYQKLILIIASILILIILALIIKFTKFGNSIRAISQDREAASLMGINTNKILMYTVSVATLLAGIAAVLALPNETLEPTQGFNFLIFALTIVILGGMGSLTGSILGAYLIAFFTVGTSVFIPQGSYFTNLVPLILIVIIILIRPRGLLGKKEIKQIN